MLKIFTDEYGNTTSYQDDLSGEFIIRQSGKDEISFPAMIIKRWFDARQDEIAAILNTRDTGDKSEDEEVREVNTWMINELIKRYPKYASALEEVREGGREGWLVDCSNHLTLESHAADLLVWAFSWAESPQGHLFWHNWHEDLKNV